MSDVELARTQLDGAIREATHVAGRVQPTDVLISEAPAALSTA